MAPPASHNLAPAADSQANYKNLLAGTLARGVVFSALALAITPFISTAPVYAADDNTVSIAVDQNTVLQPTGTLYKATTNVTVKTGKPYGFNLTMQADTADLINSKDLTHKISATPSSTPVALNANQWGYSLSKSATTFSAVPAGAQATPAVVADVTKTKPAGCTNPASCTKSVTFAANIDPVKLASGSYSTAITYTATAKSAPAPTVDPTTCKSGDPQNDCQVDLDANMIPVKYTGSTTNAQWTSFANPEDSSNQGNWYNYNNKQWANAITVKKEALAKYKGQTKVVDQADILGFWVYIPRYAYEVMRRDGTDNPVSAQNFLISFEKKTTPKRRPAVCPEKGKDYRTQCDLDRSYIKGQPNNQGTWATHPAFTFGSKELNGIWFAKFETTGTTTQPTVLPNEAYISGYYSGMNHKIGNFYSLSKTLGVNDPRNVGGGNFTTTQNNHHFAKLSSHMVNNNDWGAATYLSASKYGAGYNGVQINSQASKHDTGNGETWGTTGCGPYANGDVNQYGNRSDAKHGGISTGSLGTQQACSSDGTRAYNGTLGQLASTTNNPTGIYDMSGGGWEYVAASYSDNLNNSHTQNFGDTAHPPYVNTYNITNLNSCTFNTCGGQALYETNNGTGDGSGNNQWNSQYLYMSNFFSSSSPWLNRGGSYHGGSDAGLFYANNDDGGGYGAGFDAFRVALAPAPDPPKPKYTTNGCIISLDGDNCQRYDTYDDDDDEVTWNGERWVRHNGNYDYAKGKWVMAADEDEYNKYDKDSGKKRKDNLGVRVYIPRFAKEGTYIRFCKYPWRRENRCSDSDVVPAFRFSGGSSGFWIPLTTLGCKKYVEEPTPQRYYTPEELAAAKILIDAFGSPCPK